MGSTCRLHASRTLNLLPCISVHGIGEPGKLRTKAVCTIRYYQSDILPAVFWFGFDIVLQHVHTSQQGPFFLRYFLLISISYEVGISMWLQHIFTERRNHEIRGRACLLTCLKMFDFIGKTLSKSRYFLLQHCPAINVYISYKKKINVTFSHIKLHP